MKEQTFEEQFPNLKGMYVPIPIGDGIQPPEEYDMAIRLELIKRYCLDKQKVNEAIIKFRDNIFDTGEMSKEDRGKLTIKFDILNDELGL
mgnify:CR=1 FL=1